MCVCLLARALLLSQSVCCNLRLCKVHAAHVHIEDPHGSLNKPANFCLSSWVLDEACYSRLSMSQTGCRQAHASEEQDGAEGRNRAQSNEPASTSGANSSSNASDSKNTSAPLPPLPPVPKVNLRSGDKRVPPLQVCPLVSSYVYAQITDVCAPVEGCVHLLMPLEQACTAKIVRGPPLLHAVLALCERSFFEARAHARTHTHTQTHTHTHTHMPVRLLGGTCVCASSLSRVNKVCIEL